jgi:hypothetical protein
MERQLKERESHRTLGDVLTHPNQAAQLPSASGVLLNEVKDVDVYVTI